ncbi:SPOR domain-containing protein [Teredinibacter turnerae]|uniref:SPOR domain-containing protein n=1 Tax=Teredinibacter turnerae TaxID=2426 RepID=UPI00037491EA|nr:SPOR domain-containing protein [Teredinibacter turnerae]
MAQDYSRTRRSSNRRKSNEPRVPAWVWLFTGCVLGAFIMFLMRLSQLDPVQRIADSKTTSSSSAKVAKKESKPTQPKFDFYEVLKETRVSIPELTDKDNTVSSDEPPAQTDTYEYILQVASFKNVDDAEELRVQLLLLNLDARVERAEVRKGDTWNRVLVGPFESRSLLAKARSTLVSNHHEALVLKRMKTPAP